MTKLLTLILSICAGMFFGGIAHASSAQDKIMDIKSLHSFNETVERLENAVTSRDLKVIAKVEHSKGAAAADLDLRPTVLVLFGHPKAGTPLMQLDQRVGLDLPLRVVVWENAAGETILTYREPSFVSDAWELDPTPPQIGGMTKAIAAITAEAAGN